MVAKKMPEIVIKSLVADEKIVDQILDHMDKLSTIKELLLEEYEETMFRKTMDKIEELAKRMH